MFPLCQTADVIVLCDSNNVPQLRDIQVVSRNLHNRLAPQGTVSVQQEMHHLVTEKKKPNRNLSEDAPAPLPQDPSLDCGPV